MYAQSGELRIHFQDQGVGPPLVLVHGWGADLESNWAHTGWLQALTRQRRVVAMDVRGHGGSDKPHVEAAYTYAAMSADVLAVMDHLGLERCDFMGYSMGAFMGAWLLGHQAHRFHAFVLAGIGEETRESAAQGSRIARILRSGPSEHPVRRFVEAVPGFDLEALACSATAMWPDGSPARLVGLRGPRPANRVLIVNGSQDHPYVTGVGPLLARLSAATYAQIPGADHLSAVAHSRFKRLVLDFLDRDTEGL